MIQVPGTTQVINQPEADVDLAKTWVFGKSAELSSMNDEHSNQMMGQISASNYMNDLSYMDGSNPNTYTNQKKNYIDQLLADERFTPPNPLAQELWGQYTQAFKQDQVNKAIAVELQPRIQARINHISKGVEMHSDSIKNNPELYNEKMEEFNLVMGDNNSIIPPQQANTLRQHTKEIYKSSYMQGMVKLDPKALMMEITSGKHNDLDNKMVDKFYQGALSNYILSSKRDIETIAELVNVELETILENGGDLGSTRLASSDISAISSDEMLLKLTVQSDWYSDVSLEEVDGKCYLINNNTSLDKALNKQDAVPLKNVAQGKRILKQLKRMFG